MTPFPADTRRADAAAIERAVAQRVAPLEARLLAVERQFARREAAQERLAEGMGRTIGTRLKELEERLRALESGDA